MIETLFVSLVSIVGDSTDTTTKETKETANCSPRSDDSVSTAPAISRATSVCSAESEDDRIHSREVLLRMRDRCRGANTSDTCSSRITLADVENKSTLRPTLPIRAVQDCKSSISAEDALPVSSPTSWAMSRIRSSQDSPENNTRRSVKSILNKLTADNFKTLVVKLEQCGLKTSAELEILVQAVFEVAAAQRNESGIYADLCAHLVSASGNARYCFILRRMLREQTLQRFEELLKFCDADDAETPGGSADQDSDAEEARVTQKMRMLGNVRFMGELLVRNVIRSNELLAYLDALSCSWCSHRRLEALAVLLTVVGPVFDDVRNPEFSPLSGTFMRIQAMMVDEWVPKRVRCLLQDVLDLRYAFWMSPKQLQAGMVYQ